MKSSGKSSGQKAPIAAVIVVLLIGAVCIVGYLAYSKNPEVKLKIGKIQTHKLKLRLMAGMVGKDISNAVWVV